MNRRSRLALIAPCLALLAGAALSSIDLRAQLPQPSQPPAASWLLRPQQVFDATGEQAHPGWVVLVTGNKIVAVGPAATVTAPADARTVDLPGMTLLPGLIEAHTHIFLHAYNETLWNDQVLKESEAYRTIEAVRHCERTLLGGFTTIRDLGTEGAGYADVAVQRAINEGLIPGPRLFIATRAIVATASYGPGPARLRAERRYAERRAGSEWNPGSAEGGQGADRPWGRLGGVYADYRRGTGPSMPTFNLDELKALVEEAHSAGRPVSAHASTAEGMRRAVVAGVDTIEHGYGGTDEVFRLMAEHNVALLPDPSPRRRRRRNTQGPTSGVARRLAPWNRQSRRSSSP